MMIDPETVVKDNQKRSYDEEDENLLSKHVKCDINIDLESISSEEFENENEDFDLSTDQNRSIPVVSNEKSSRNEILNKYIEQFQIIIQQNQKNSIDLTKTFDENLDLRSETFQGEYRLSYNRTHLLQIGYPILSSQSYPFYSLCYLCGSIGNDLIYCNSCCQPYHLGCLNESERPEFLPTPESWLCPNCNLCSICGLNTPSSLLTCFDCKKTFHIQCLTLLKPQDQNSLIWFCPLCLKCDCGEKLTDQSLMCSDCSNNFKQIQMKKTSKIRKCHLCEKFIEHYLPKPKPLFSLSLIGNQTKSKTKTFLFLCQQCEQYFHPKCDGYLNEDVTLIKYIENQIKKIICSKCDQNQKESIRNSLKNYKIQIVKNLISTITSTLQIMISDDNHLLQMKSFMSNLQQLHQSRHQSLHLHGFLNDLFILIQHLLINMDTRQWQAAIINCIQTFCPWFQPANHLSTNQTMFCSSTNASLSFSNLFRSNYCLPNPSLDHTYSLTTELLFFRSNHYKTHLLTSTDSLLRYISSQKENSFENFHQIDTRICQLCQTYADHFSTNISRLIPIGYNQWIHIGCILPAYSKHLQQLPYILKNLPTILNDCQTKFQCEICFEMGASVHCSIRDCSAHFHCQCIENYYRQEQPNSMVKGLLPNLTTLCPKHNKENFIDHHHHSINFSSPIYVDLSNNKSFQFSLTDLKLALGSLQIHSFGNFDYLLESDPILHPYPNQYHASRLFWNTKNAREKTIYHLYINIYQTYHDEKSNHRTILQQNTSSNQMTNVNSEKVLESYDQWLKTKFGRIEFTIESTDGYKIVSEDLDRAWSTIVDLIRDCRDNMNLTHLSLINDHLTGHQIFGLTNPMIENIFNQILNQENIVRFSNYLFKKKNWKKIFFSKKNSRLNIYQRKSKQNQRFQWLRNPNRKIEYALKTFEIDPALAYSRNILLEKSSHRLLLYHLSYFSDRVLVVHSSSIHGCGLFTLIDLVKGQMIIEYKGEVIRSCLTDKREKYYEKQELGCYMFTVDSMNVIDATDRGNKARFINHHCQPNCFAKTIISNGLQHIVIYALKNIPSGSELTYDYSFVEEDIKIPCFCGTNHCRMYLN